MKLTLKLVRGITAVVGLTVAAVAAIPASAETFRNGESFYGQPSRGGADSRVVDLATAKFINVEYGETVTFRSQGKEFSWTFDGLDRSAVYVKKIAPAGFATTPMKVYVAPNPLNMS